jgi:mannose-6-phosphate isomerase-like protein (cupin superfamily)
MRTDEACGGDPPCWSHLFEETVIAPVEAGADHESGAPAAREADPDETGAVDLAAVARSVNRRGPAWTLRSADLDANLLVFGAGEGVAEHVTEGVDVLLVGVVGEGVVTIDGKPRPLRAGAAILVPKGARRGIRAVGDRFAYLTCHRRRAGLWPAAGNTAIR